MNAQFAFPRANRARTYICAVCLDTTWLFERERPTPWPEGVFPPVNSRDAWWVQGWAGGHQQGRLVSASDDGGRRLEASKKIRGIRLLTDPDTTVFVYWLSKIPYLEFSTPSPACNPAFTAGRPKRGLKGIKGPALCVGWPLRGLTSRCPLRPASRGVLAGATPLLETGTPTGPTYRRPTVHKLAFFGLRTKFRIQELARTRRVQVFL